jgi:hypothetical protein
MSLNNVGTYKVELDAGFFQDVFTLDSDADGILDQDFLDGSTSFFDVTQYVANVQVNRGRSSQDQQFGAATASIILDDSKGQDRFSVANQASPYWNIDRGRLGFEPRRKVRISRNNEYIFNGFIVKYDTVFDIDGHNMVTVSVSDAFFILANTNLLPSDEWEDGVVKEMSGDRVRTVLGRPEINFPDDIPVNISDGVAELGEVAVDSQTPLAYINLIVESAEQGRFYVDRNGTLVFTDRTPQSTDTAPTLEFRDDGTQYPFETLEIVYE